MEDGQQVAGSSNTPPREYPGAQEASYLVALERIKGLLTGTDTSIEQLAEGISAITKLEKDLSKDKLAATKGERAELKSLAADRTSGLSVEKKAIFDVTKQIWDMKAATERLMGSNPAAAATFEKQHEAAVAGLRQAQVRKAEEAEGALQAWYTEAENKAKPKKVSYLETAGGMYSEASKSTIFKQALTLGPATAKAEAALGAAGAPSGGGILNSTLGTGLLSPTKTKELITLLAEAAPRAFQNTTESVTQMIGVLGSYGNTVEESVAILARATFRGNITAQDITNANLYAASSSQRLGISTKDTAKLLEDMTVSLRGAGLGMSSAIGLLAGFDGHIKSMNMDMSGDEISKFTQNVAGALGNLSPELTAGLMQYTNGGRMPQFQKEIEGVNPVELAQKFFNKMTQNMASGSAGRYYATGAAGKLLGINSGNIETRSALEQLLSGNNLTKASVDALKASNPSAEAQSAKGWETLSGMKQVLDKMANNLDLITSQMSLGLNKVLSQPAAQGAGIVIGVAKELMTGAALWNMSGASGFLPIAAEGLETAAAIALSPEVIVGGLGVAGVYGAYKYSHAKH